MKLPQSNNNGNSKTILALLHTIIIRYFQFAKIKDKNEDKSNDKEEMEVDNNENKMSEEEQDEEEEDDAKMESKSVKSNKDKTETDEQDVIVAICLNILSIPYYTERLTRYNLQSVTKSFISDNIWNAIITEFEKYCIDLYESFIFIT